MEASNIHMKTCSSLVKMISDEENNCILNICNKLMKYIEIFYLIKKWGSSPIYLLCVDLIEIANSKLLIKHIFIRYKNAWILVYLQLKYFGIRLHGLDMRDTIYTNSIIKGFLKARNKSYRIWHMKLKHNNIYLHDMGTSAIIMDFFIFIKSIVKSYMEGKKCSNVLLLTYTYTYTQTHT